jgi:uridine kinase
VSLGETGLRRALDLVDRLKRRSEGPVVVAIDGRSGVGKSTLAAQLAPLVGGTVIDGDDFYAGGVGILGDPLPARASRCIDWQAQRRVLAALRRGEAAVYHAFDWDAFDGRLRPEVTRISAAPVILLEGVYSGRPELADLVDAAILVTVPDTVRHARLLGREGEIGPWELQWHEAEDWYFAHAAPKARFDLILDLT